MKISNSEFFPNYGTSKICTYRVQSSLASDFTKHMWINTVNQVNRTEGSGYVTIMALEQ